MIRARNWLLSAVVLGLGLVGTSSAQQGVQWHLNLDAAKNLAARTNRLVLLHFWSASCAPCMKMDQEVFSQPDVAAALGQYYIPVKIDADKTPRLARQHIITHLPTDVVITPSGEEIERNVGALPPASYLSRMSQIAVNARSRVKPLANIPAGATVPIGGPPQAAVGPMGSRVDLAPRSAPLSYSNPPWKPPSGACPLRALSAAFYHIVVSAYIHAEIRLNSL